MSEQNMVDNLNNDYPKISLIHKNVNSNNEPDVSFKGKIDGAEYYFALEVKVANEHNIANYSKQMLSEILINRKHFSIGNFINKTGVPITYGILLSYDDTKVDALYEYMVKHFLSDDWIEFGLKYNCKYVFLYDSVGKQLYYQDWKTFLISLSPIEYN